MLRFPEVPIIEVCAELVEPSARRFRERAIRALATLARKPSTLFPGSFAQEFPRHNVSFGWAGMVDCQRGYLHVVPARSQRRCCWISLAVERPPLVLHWPARTRIRGSAEDGTRDPRDSHPMRR